MTTPISATTAFVRFARHLRGTHPQVPISTALNDQITGFIDRVRLGQPLDDDGVGWESVVCSMAEGATSLASGERRVPYCSLPLLRVFGQLGEALLATCPVRLPAPIAIALLMDYQPLPLLFDWADETRVVTTPTGIEQLRGRGSFRVPDVRQEAWEDRFFLWHIERLADHQGRLGLEHKAGV
ncbi:hypothetical protein [uncultured Enterovirga sp.]|uniref:hypothetical protein n=1 Tax=uncultured Enterovirga sp. TaxID=2026352 RepID=UPI0035CB8BA4